METLDIPQVATTRAAETPASAPALADAVVAGVRMAYLLSRYPAVSHTFFLHEVLGLRARGISIETASINPPDRPLHTLPEQEASEAASTFYLKSGRAAALATLVGVLLTQPAVVWRGLWAVFSLGGLTVRQRVFSLFYLAEALLLGRWMQRRKLPHLHVHFGGAVATVGMLAAAAWRVPFSLTIHGPEELLDTSTYHLREKLTSASFVVCISDFCRSQLCRLLPPDQWTKLQVVRLGVDPMLLRPSVRPSAPAAGTRALELVCTGRLVPDKAQSILLEALAELQRRDVAVHATVIGAGPEERYLLRRTVELGLAEQVRFTSALNHKETLAHLRHADIFALPSFAEGIPVALMEAMSLAIPCISTFIAGIPELIRSGQDGLLVAPGNVAALADAIESLANDARLRRTLGASARQRVIALYNLPLNQELLSHTFATRVEAASTCKGCATASEAS